jgi:2,3-bisphosphoglycerate-dependent phosphoglycerate mutase
MALTRVVFETHSWSEDNELGRASGWNHGALSAEGRRLAEELGGRRRSDGIDVVLVSDLRRALETAEIAFAGTGVAVLHDWRLRECDYGDLNGMPVATVHAAVGDARDRYPGGESRAEAVDRVGAVLDDISVRWSGERVLIIGHMSSYWALEHRCHGLPLESIGGRFDWQHGWEYDLLAE